MNIRRTVLSAFAAMTALLLAAPSYAGKPDIFRSMFEFDLLVVECDGFEVWTTGWERDTEKWWYNEFDEPVRLQFSVNITESEYYNNTDPTKFVTQGKNGVGENFTNNIDLTTGDERWSGALFRLTIPGIGHVLLDMGTWFWDASAATVVHYGPDYALAEGETGLALCEALE